MENVKGVGLLRILLKIPRTLFIGLPDEIKRNGLGRALNRYLHVIGVKKDISLFIIKFIKIILNPLSYVQSKYTRRYIRTKNHYHIDRKQAYLHLPSGETEDIDNLLIHCEKIFKPKHATLKQNFKPPYSFILSIGDYGANNFIEDVALIAPIIDFAAQPKILSIVSEYLQEVPIISGLSYIYSEPSPPGYPLCGPQQFHRDMNERKQIHLLVNINDITKDTGPFCFIPAEKTKYIALKLKYNGGRVSDENIFNHINLDQLIQCTGPKGTINFVNAYACFHQGARVKQNYRLLLIINFVSRFEAIESRRPLYTSINRDTILNHPLKYPEAVKDLLNL